MGKYKCLIRHQLAESNHNAELIVSFFTCKGHVLLKWKVIVNCNAKEMHWVIYWEIKMMFSVSQYHFWCLLGLAIYIIPLISYQAFTEFTSREIRPSKDTGSVSEVWSWPPSAYIFSCTVLICMNMSFPKKKKLKTLGREHYLGLLLA